MPTSPKGGRCPFHLGRLRANVDPRSAPPLVGPRRAEVGPETAGQVDVVPTNRVHSGR